MANEQGHAGLADILRRPPLPPTGVRVAGLLARECRVRWDAPAASEVSVDAFEVRLQARIGPNCPCAPAKYTGDASAQRV